MRGLLLINLGTPAAPTTEAVRSYLKEFLSDPLVVDLPAFGRWLLLNLVILPFRPAKSAAAYRQVWTERGSPLRNHCEDLREALQTHLEGRWQVELAMRYSGPSIQAGLESLLKGGVSSLVVLPLYPHYASSSTGSSLAELARAVEAVDQPVPLEIIDEFYADPEFIEAVGAVLAPYYASRAPDHLLVSCHGLPVRQVKALATADSPCCREENCCESVREDNRRCYRAQCLETARLLARGLDLSPDQWSLSFQSRLGARAWLSPSTPERLDALAEAGVKRLAVVCPSFTADCLETLEEIEIRARAQFLEAGGEELWLVPCVNSSPRWVSGIGRMIERCA
jgi:ferrochelatase